MKRMLINAIDPEESRIAVVEDGVLQELHVELASREAYLGNIYKGKVVNIEPSIGAAFVAFGGRVNGFLHVSDVLPAYGRDDFQLEDVIEGRARVDVDDGPESMQQALDDSDDEDDDGAEDGAGDASGDAALAGDDEQHDGVERVDLGDDHDHDDGHGDGDHGDGDHHDDGEHDGDLHDDGDAVVEAVEQVQVDEGSDGEPGDHDDDRDAADDDHPGGFGHGVDERPLAMAAADPGGDDAGGEPADAGGDAGSDAATGAPAGEEGAEGGGRRRRSRGRGRRGRRGAGNADAHAGVDGDDGGAAGTPGVDGQSTDGQSVDGQSVDGGAAEGEASLGEAAGDRGAESGADSVGEGAPAQRSSEQRQQQGQGGRGRDRDRGRRGGRNGGGNGGNGGNDRRPRGPRMTIDQLLKKGQEVVVQITKEGIGTKGPTLTTYVSLPGRCLVLMPSLPKCGVSRKIDNSKERRRLKRIVKELDETGHGGIGFIVRTAGINKSLEDLQRDRDYLKKIWELVAQRLKVTKAPALLYQESDLVLKAMRDQFTPNIADVVVDSEDVYMRIRDFAEKLMPQMADRIKRHAVTTPLFHSFGIEKDVEALYQPKVDLPNGASIVIDQAEALVAIDVNSGKYKAGGDSDETAYRTNLDAIPEIVRQLRLRDLGGLIIIDFIDMSREKDRRNVERRLIDALRGDRARIKVGRISPFGMLEITRQRVGPGLKRTVFMQCPHCHGAGWSRTVQSKALSVLREVRALVNLKGYSMLQVFVAPAVSDYLVNYKRRAVLELEDAVGKTVVFRPEQSYPIDVVHYRFLTGDGQEARIAIPAGLGVKA
ncbi:MAG: Rne/Rng family ribonuclease [Planctomycetes bacterium]|nr:Rne/Rng family ribonuclease [Planctomycetota bacterium]